jgi:hypothetical protein
MPVQTGLKEHLLPVYPYSHRRKNSQHKHVYRQNLEHTPNAATPN